MQLSLRLNLFLLFSFAVTNISWTANRTGSNHKSIQYLRHQNPGTGISAHAEAMYDSIGLDEWGLSEAAFVAAVNGFAEMKSEGVLQNDSILTIIDFDQPGINKRLYVVDVKHAVVLFNTWAAHGRNSGKEWAESFSNKPSSLKSSLGFYITSETYFGSHGLSLRLNGVEPGINDKARNRAIVMHGASYVSQAFIDAEGYLGRSHGCPAIPLMLAEPIIDKIKGGSCLFIYNKTYHPNSRFSLG
jgi:hypothetical protein